MRKLSAIRDVGRILLVTPQPFYEDRGTPIAVKYVAEALSQLGARVDVLAFPVGQDVHIPNVNVVRCANPLRLKSVPIGFSWRKLALDASLWRAFNRLVHSANYDLVHAVEEAAYMASMICPRLGVPFIYDMASAIPSEMARKGVFDNELARRAFSRIEKHVIRSATRVVCSTGLAEHVLDRVPDANVREWLYPALFERADEAETAALRATLGLRPSQRVVLFSGNLAAYQGIGLLMEAFQRARRIRPELVLVCVGASERELSTGVELAQQAADNVIVLPRQPRASMPAFLKLANYLVLPRVGAENAPLKLFDYMASGKPIVATRGAAHEPLLNTSRAFLSDPNAGSFAAAILMAHESPARAASVGVAAQTYARQNFGWDRFVDFVGTTYREAIEEDYNLRRLVA